MLHHETIALSEAHRHDLLADSARVRDARRRRGPSLRFRRGRRTDSG